MKKLNYTLIFMVPCTVAKVMTIFFSNICALKSKGL